MDNGPTHSLGLAYESVEVLDFITVKFQLPNLTHIIHPVDQQVISNFKKLYTKAFFQRCFEVTSDTKLTLRDSKKHQFNILHCLIDKAWQQVMYRNMDLALRKLCLDCVTSRNFEGFNSGDFVVDSCVSWQKYGV